MSLLLLAAFPVLTHTPSVVVFSAFQWHVLWPRKAEKLHVWIQELFEGEIYSKPSILSIFMMCSKIFEKNHGLKIGILNGGENKNQPFLHGGSQGPFQELSPDLLLK
jgi:hypothetical protein